ncbi:MAG: TlpA family protein disulfide reductase [Gammaproteobacteria bacterium]|nr:TlpA family protein disulfide reductase [Gammaproteobacteria bacterium]
MKSLFLSLKKIPLLLLLYSGSVPAEILSIKDAAFKTPNGIIDADTFNDKVILVDFWASWCKPCLESFPWMNEMHQKYADSGLHIVAVNLDKDEELIDKFLAKVSPDFTIAYDKSATLAKQFGVSAMPSSFYYGRDGKLVARHLGFRDNRKDKYEAQIRALLGIN